MIVFCYHIFLLHLRSFEFVARILFFVCHCSSYCWGGREVEGSGAGGAPQGFLLFKVTKLGWEGRHARSAFLWRLCTSLRALIARWPFRPKLSCCTLASGPPGSEVVVDARVAVRSVPKSDLLLKIFLISLVLICCFFHFLFLMLRLFCKLFLYRGNISLL